MPATRIRPSRSRCGRWTVSGSCRCRPNRARPRPPERRPTQQRDKTPRGGQQAMVSLSAYLGVGALLFAIAVIGIFLNRKNLIVLLMAIELMLLAVNTNFIAFSHYLNDPAGQIFVF